MLHVEGSLRNFQGQNGLESSAKLMYILYVSTESLQCHSDLFVAIVSKHLM